MLLNESQLKDFILDSGLVSRKDAEFAFAEAKASGKSAGEILVNQGKIGDDDLRRMHAHILGVPFVDLKTGRIPFEALLFVPEPISRNHNVIAFKKTDTRLEIAVLDLEDMKAVEFLREKTGLKMLPRLTDTESMKKAILEYQKGLRSQFGDVIAHNARSLKSLPKEFFDRENPDEETLRALARNISVREIVHTLLRHALAQNASGVHVEPREEELAIRYRIDGQLHDAMILPKTMLRGLSACVKTLSNLSLEEKRLPQDGRFKIDVDGEVVSFRVSTVPAQYGEKIFMRVLRDNVSGFTLERLGFHGDGVEHIHRAAKSRSGAILVASPAGEGKTTVLYTILDMVNTPHVSVSSIEDPVEYQMKRVTQTQIRPEIGYTFVQGIRTLVRQDSDIIMVGDLRDNESASAALNASLTGRLTLSGVEADSAADAVIRLLGHGVEPFLLSSTVKVVVAQRLIRKLGENKEKYFLSKAEIQTLGKTIDLDKVLSVLKAEKIVKTGDTWEKVSFWKAKKGADPEEVFSGRVGIQEILHISPAIKDIVLKLGTEKQIQKQAEKEGMLTLLEDGVVKAVMGETTLEEILHLASQK